MKKSTLIASAAVASLLASGIAATAAAEGAEAKVKCYGIAKAGHNDCASADGSHSCAGHAKMDNDPNEWKMVDNAEACGAMGGQATAPVTKEEMNHEHGDEGQM